MPPTDFYIVRADFGKHGWGFVGDEHYSFDAVWTAIGDHFDATAPSLDNVQVWRFQRDAAPR
ncbi:MAG: hypothetical protein EBT13_17215, partial [Rhodobacteraceae bacterium]|nr:hypothetical protein [Paracoccaceae bacterium]